MIASEAILKQSADFDLELVLLLQDFLDVADVALPFEHLRLLVNFELVARLLSNDLDAVDFAEDLQVEARDHLPAKVELALQLTIKHGQDSIVEFGQVKIDLLLRRLRTHVKMLGEQHATDALGDRAHTLVEVCKELVDLSLVSPHVHSVQIHGGLVAIANVHHLDHS